MAARAALLRPASHGLRHLRAAPRPRAASRAARAAPPSASASLGLDLDPAAAAGATPIHTVLTSELDGLVARLGSDVAAWASASGFKAEAGKALLLPGPGGSLAGVLFGLGDGEDPFALGAAPSALPARTYALANAPDATAAFHATLGWALGSYKFARYKAVKDTKPVALLAPAANAAAAEVARIASAVYLGRDLINTPANDLGPAELEAAAEALARAHGGTFSSIVGDALLSAPGGGYPLIHAVGRAATPERAPRLLDLRWGREDAPRVTLVGKGVCFDTGGLDIKPASNMVNMKKDMGGAATVLSLASMLMAAKARIRLRVLIPAVENSVAGGAFRPGDVIKARSGLTVEIGNTDAEGRLVLADALTLADEDVPEVLVDVATLTGAHRVALGTELPGIFTDDEALASQLLAAGVEVGDPLWRLPLWKPYARMLDSKVADLNNVSSGPYGGAITAALFLRRFVAERSQRSGWVHVDENGWTATSRPGHPEGGEPQAARAMYRALCARYGCDASKA